MGAGTYYGRQSRAELDTCHPHLVLWAETLLAHPELPYDLRIWEGHRDQRTQDHYRAIGRSRVRWPHGRHNSIPSLAADVLPIVDRRAQWHRPAMEQIAPLALAVWADLRAAGRVEGTLVWGGDWDQDGDSDDERFFDGAHYQIDL